MIDQDFNLKQCSAFNEMDENHDGKISQSEFVEVSMMQISYLIDLSIIYV